MPTSARLRRSPDLSQGIDGIMQLRLDERAALGHPEIPSMPECSVASSATQPSNSSCILCGKFGARHFECDSEPGTEHERDGHADPDRRQPVLAAGLFEIACDNADDQGRLDTFAEHDQERDEQE